QGQEFADEFTSVCNHVDPESIYEAFCTDFLNATGVDEELETREEPEYSCPTLQITPLFASNAVEYAFFYKIEEIGEWDPNFFPLTITFVIREGSRKQLCDMAYRLKEDEPLTFPFLIKQYYNTTSAMPIAGIIVEIKGS